MLFQQHRLLDQPDRFSFRFCPRYACWSFGVTVIGKLPLNYFTFRTLGRISHVWPLFLAAASLPTFPELSRLLAVSDS